MNPRAPKQWSLTKQETITSFEAWRQNLHYILSLDRNFAGFLSDGVTWLKKSPGSHRRGLQDDPESAPQASRRTAQQKCTHLELILGEIANYCPVISCNTIVKNSTSMSFIWQAIHLHFGFQSTDAHFLDFNNITLAPAERPEDLYLYLRLSATKIVICPKTTTILGWIWSQGSLSANPHRIAALTTCSPPDMRSFVGALAVSSLTALNLWTHLNHP